jgi:hypothetical protein
LLRNEGEDGFEDASLGLPADDRLLRDVRMADLDLDGDDDLIYATEDPSGVRIYLNDGTGRFQDQTRLLVPQLLGPAARLAIADFEADGDPDIVLVRSADRTALLINGLDERPEPTPEPTATPGPEPTPTP